jgi:hypothetical protein
MDTMPPSDPSLVARSRQKRRPRRMAEAAGLCVETQGREIMAVLVHDVVAEAMTLNLYGKPAECVDAANGAPVRHPGKG